MGAWAWKMVIPSLEKRGHAAFPVTLTGMGDRVHLATKDVGMEMAIQDVLNVVKYNDLDDFVLVGHSFAGKVAAAVADRAHEKVRKLIYLDAFGTDDETADAILIELDSVTIELDAGTEVAYAALSYCWGSNPANMYKTGTATLEARKERIWFAELPRTLQDAFRICRRLCIPALWIDALCIVQDSRATGRPRWREWGESTPAAP